LYKVTGARLNEVKLPHVIAMLSWVGNVQNEYLLQLNGWTTVERVEYRVIIKVPLRIYVDAKKMI